MLVKNFRITNYKSVSDSGLVDLSGQTTVLVGRNESGKTAILEALHKARSVEEAKYDYIADFPRKGLNEYEPHHKEDPALVVEIAYQLEASDVAAVNTFLKFDLIEDLSFVCLHHLDNTARIRLTLDEGPLVGHLRDSLPLPEESRSAVADESTVRELLTALGEMDLNSEASAAVGELCETFDLETSWSSVVGHAVYSSVLASRIPKFVYFDEYAMLPAKVNLRTLRLKEEKDQLEEGDKTALGLLELANVELDALSDANGYEVAKARLEGISNRITDQIFDLWTQNQTGERQELEVLFDLKSDPNEVPPFNNGPNLYVRIRGLRHRVSVPFDKRSRGFKWFFSFVVWFENVKRRMNVEERLVLLLDEPGLSLHALAQGDLLRYFDRLSAKHQIVFTTHSPFMVRSERLSEVRLVEDLSKVGTTVSSDVANGDSRTVFPLQAALGYSVAQNLFLSSKNLLVEGVSDFLYLQSVSGALQRAGREGLRDDVVIMPVGGLDKLATFVALLSGNDLSFVVLHDWSKAPEQRLVDLVSKKLVGRRSILNYAMFVGEAEDAVSHADVEDMFDEDFFVALFCDTFASELGRKFEPSEVPSGKRIVERLGRLLKDNNLSVRKTEGFNHYRPASFLASNPAKLDTLSSGTLDRFEALFKKVNSQL